MPELHKCHWVGCTAPVTHRIVPLYRTGKVFFTCTEHVPGQRRPVDAPWPLCYRPEPMEAPQ